MEGHCLTGQSPQWAVVPMVEGEDVFESSCHVLHMLSGVTYLAELVTL